MVQFRDGLGILGCFLQSWNKTKTMNYHFRYPRIHSRVTGVSLGHSDMSNRHGDLGHKSTNSFSVGLTRYRIAAADLGKRMIFYSFHIVLRISGPTTSWRSLLLLQEPQNLWWWRLNPDINCSRHTWKQSCEKLGLVSSNLTEDNTKLASSCYSCL